MGEPKIEKRVRMVALRRLANGETNTAVYTFDGDGWFSPDENGLASYPYGLANYISWIEERVAYEADDWVPVDLDKHLAGVGTVEPDYSNLVLNRAQLIDQLKARQHQLCAYATTQGDGRTCDCKYNMLPGTVPFRGEVTGCPELRQAIRVLEAMED